jgi:hypothetical protein
MIMCAGNAALQFLKDSEFDCFLTRKASPRFRAGGLVILRSDAQDTRAMAGRDRAAKERGHIQTVSGVCAGVGKTFNLLMKGFGGAVESKIP